MKNGKIDSFTDLNVWKEGHSLVVMIYNETKNFPRSELYSLIDQMRRSSASVTANIAEGFARHSYKEKAQFYYLSKGSLSELRNFLYIAKDVGYLPQDNFQILFDQIIKVDQLLQGFIRKTKTYIPK